MPRKQLRTTLLLLMAGLTAKRVLEYVLEHRRWRKEEFLGMFVQHDGVSEPEDAVLGLDQRGVGGEQSMSRVDTVVLTYIESLIK